MKVKKKFTVPIYGSTVWVIITDDIDAERRKMEDVFGVFPMENPEALEGLCSSCANTYGIFFKPNNLTIENVAHEVFHLTHRILEWKEIGFDANHHEAAAYLHGYLMDLVMKNVKLCKTQR